MKDSIARRQKSSFLLLSPDFGRKRGVFGKNSVFFAKSESKSESKKIVYSLLFNKLSIFAFSSGVGARRKQRESKSR